MGLVLIFGLLMGTITLGMPIAFAIGICGLIYLMVQPNMPIQLIPSLIFSGMNSFPLLAIPFYVLAGELMNEGGLTIRLISLARAAVGHIRGGMAHISILSCMLLSGVSGSGAADTAAVGGLMIPAMKKQGYGGDFATAVVAASGTMGPLIPPSLLMVIYGYLAGVSIGQLFVGGIIPGVLVAVGLMITSYLICVRRGYKEQGEFSWRELFRSAWKAVPALIIPIVVVGGLLTGVVTATEAGILAVIVALILGVFYFKNLRSWTQFRQICVTSAQISAIVFLILGMSAILSNLLVRVQFQSIVMGTLTSLASSPTQMFLLILLFIFILGFFVDTTAMLIMFAAPMAKVAASIGLNPIHFGTTLIFVAMIGAVTPPVSGLVFIACTVGKTPLAEVLRIIWPFVFALAVVLMIVALVPGTVTWLPSLFY